MQNETQEQSRGMQTLWICLTIGVVAFIGLGIALQDEDDCKGFMGSEDKECVRARAVNHLMGLPIG